jgi:hypothetical protein
MGRFGDQLRYHARSFVTNWRDFEGSLATKLGLAIRNRSKGLVNRGCCGRYGEPGC